MAKSRPEIVISSGKKDQPAVKLPPDPNQIIADRYDFQTKIILAIFVIAFITMIVMVATLVIDSFHINSTIYKEYSDKNDVIKSLQESNKILLETVQQNQKIIEEFINKNSKQ
ncbi:hypothetical protein HYS95_00805 [Candidatus Daviesbacteria bacterium]|nr:hypothetical protein [Candidatus Daviesbacteria bacterium]